jgi:hypothetical protein
MKAILFACVVLLASHSARAEEEVKAEEAVQETPAAEEVTVERSERDAPYGSRYASPSYGYRQPTGYSPSPAPSYGNDYCDPKQPPKCAHYNQSTFCFEDPEYPEYEIKQKLEEDKNIQKKIADVASQSADDLVEYISKHQEENFDYSFYNAGHLDKTHWTGPEGYICPSDVAYGRPLRAQNVKGEWRVIVNLHYYTQTARFETCLFPQTACRLIAPCYKSQCLQKYVYERLLSYDPCDPYKGLFIDMYKIPSACSCHVPQEVKPPKYEQYVKSPY